MGVEKEEGLEGLVNVVIGRSGAIEKVKGVNCVRVKGAKRLRKGEIF